MTLNQLRTALREGKEPRELGRWIGAGCYRTAYSVGPFVVKNRGTVCKKDEYDVAELRQRKVRFAPTIKVGRYEIQVRYQPLDPDLPFYRIGTDIHSDNVGMDRRGRYVAFDW